MFSLLKALEQRWMAFWFEPATPTNLAVSRIVVYGPLAVFYLLQDSSGWGDVSPALFQPIWLFKTLHLPVVSTTVLGVMQSVWRLSLFMAAIGVFTTASCVVSAALGLYLLGLPHNFGQIYHFDAAIVFTFAVLSLSRCGDALSVDAWRRASRGGAVARVSASGEYTWPIRLVWVTLSLVFFAAGVAKLWTSGFEWIASDQMTLLLMRVQYHISDADPVTNWGSYIAQYPLLTRALAATTLIVETTYPLALFRTPLRPVMVLAGISLIVGIRLLMGPTFEHFLLLNAYWVPWDRVGVWLRARFWTDDAVPMKYHDGPSSSPTPSMCDVSIVIPTHNRAESLRRLLETMLSQAVQDIRYEVLVVDNNSSDATRAIVEECAAADSRVKYFMEPRPGVSHARNTGIANASAPIIAFVDDDVEARVDWLMSLKRAFDEHPDADCVGGRVRPVWTTPRPAWLTEAHVGAIAVQDRPTRFTVGAHNATPCLLTANWACRSAVFEQVGLFSPAFRRGQDRELQLRMWRAGKRGLYCPDVEVVVVPPADRLTKAYHGRWQATTAKYHALMWYRDTVAHDSRLVTIDPRRRTFLGTPLFLYREFLTYVTGLLLAILAIDANRFFHYESRLWYAVSFISTRWRQRRAGVTGPLESDVRRRGAAERTSRTLITEGSASARPLPDSASPSCVSTPAISIQSSSSSI
jgi:GT2 family glycosyltransferase